MARKLSYEEKLRRAEAREFIKVKRQQKTEDKKREKELKRQERALNVAVKKQQLKYEKDVQSEAKKQTKKKLTSRRKTKRALRKVWRRLI